MRISARFLALTGVLLAGGCSMPDTDSYRLPTASNLFRPMSVTNFREKVLPPVTAADLVDGNGNCAGAPSVPPTGDPATQPSQQALGGPIGLEMTECEVVRRMGVPARADVGANERRERTATLTYVSGDRPGIYSFTEGRLKSMELGPEPPAPEKPVKTKKKPAKPPTRRAAQPDQISVQ